MSENGAVAEKKPGRRWLKWVLRAILAVVALVVVCVVLCIGALATGWPQRKAIEVAARKGMNARAEVGKVSILGAVKVSDLRIFEGEGDQKPMIDVSGFEADYTLLPEDKRYIPYVLIDKLAVNLDRSLPKAEEPAKPAAPAKKAKKKRKKKGGVPLEFQPRSAGIRQIQFTGARPTIGLELAGLGLKAEINASNKYFAHLTGEKVAGSFWAPARGNARELAGALDIRYEKAGRETTVDPFVVDFPGLLEVSGHGEVSEGGGRTAVDIQFDKFVAQDLDLSRVDPKDFPMPLRCKKLDLSGSRLKGELALSKMSVNMPGTDIKVIADDLGLGPAGEELYEGDLTFRAVGQPGKLLDLSLEATFNRGQKLRGSICGKLLELSAQASLDNWSREDVEALLPKSVRPNLASMPTFQGFSSVSVNAGLEEMYLVTEAALKPLLGVPGGPTETAELTLTSKCSAVSLALGIKQQHETGLRARIGEGTAAVSAQLGDPTGLHAAIELEQVDPNAWFTAMTGKQDLQALATRLNGTVQVDLEKDRKKGAVALDVAASPFRYGSFALPEGQSLAVSGTVSGDNTGYFKAEGEQLEIRMGEGASLQIANWSIPFETFAVQADLTADLDLAFLASTLPIGDLRGSVHLTAPVSNDRGFTESTVALTAENLVYGSFAAPAETPLTVAGHIKYDNINNSGTVSDFDIALGEGTALSSPACKFGLSPLSMEAPCSFSTDFQPLVAVGLLSSAQGTATVSGDVKYAADGLSASVDFDAKAEALALAAGLVELKGAALTGELKHAPESGLKGAGDLAAAALGLAGVTIRDLRGPVTFEGDALKASGIEGALFGGGVQADIEIGLLRLGVPVDISATLTDVDLAALSSALGVPSVKLQGRGTGQLDLTVRYGDLEDVKFELAAGEGFAIDRAVLEPLLKYYYAKELKGKKQVEQVLAKLVGKDDVCPFDEAKITVGSAQGALATQIVLKRETLDLTIDLPSDPANLIHDLSLLVSGQLGAATDAQP